MCGIIGGFNRLGLDKDQVNRQLASIVHRGPDDGDVWMNENNTLALGSRRLAIQDLSPNGHMPMLSLDGKFVIAFNGEIYNYPALKLLLQKEGFSFRSHADTEAVLYAYIKWGAACLVHLEGMFAISIYNNETGEVFLARDRTGEKPLYYWVHQDGFEFGSELKVLFANPALERTLNPKALYEYLEVGYCKGETSFIKGVKKLKPGHFMVYSTKAQTLTIERYWAAPAASGIQRTKEELVPVLDQLLSDSVKKQLISDVPLGVLLSGGVDSSLITAYAAQHSSQRVKTFHITFDGFGKYNEQVYAKTIADYFDTEHIELSGNNLSFDTIDELVEYYDEPLADSSMLPTFLVSKLTKEHVTVALGGDGGDELFGGYTHYPMVLKHEANSMPAPLRSAAAALGSKLPVGMRGRNYIMSLKGDAYDRFLTNRLYDDVAMKNIIAKDYWSNLEGSSKSKKEMDRTGDLIYDMTKYDLEYNLTDDILVKVDRASMAVSLEMRAPWLDRNILEFAFRDVPSSLKLDTGHLKILPKALLKSKLDFDFDLTRKQGFSIPLHDWIRDKWEHHFVEELNQLPTGLISKEYSLSLLAGIKKGYTNSSKLYALLILGKWIRKYNIKL